MDDAYNYQVYVQNLQNVLLQKQAIQIQLEELKQTLEELSKYQKPRVYKSVGPVLIEEEKEKVIKDLEEQKEELEIKLKSLESQEKTLKKKVEELRAKINSHPQNSN